MAEIGKRNTLPVIKQVDFGLYLDGGELGEILIPTRYVPAGCQVDDELDVFIYLDSDDRLIATTEIPLAEVGQCANLRVVSNGKFGSFMHWGLPKDLLVPFKEQRKPMEEGESYVVHLFIDITRRIAASSKLSNFLKEQSNGQFIEGQMVDLLIASRSELGYKAVIDNTHLGLIHNSDLLKPIRVGEAYEGYVKNIREDGRINLTLQAHGAEAIDALSRDILDFIKAEGGNTDITDRSPPDVIYQAFKVSKSAYKKALGKLYKQKRIVVGEDKITLAE